MGVIIRKAKIKDINDIIILTKQFAEQIDEESVITEKYGILPCM